MCSVKFTPANLCQNAKVKSGIFAWAEAGRTGTEAEAGAARI